MDPGFQIRGPYSGPIVLTLDQWRFPKVRGPVLRAPTIRIIVNILGSMLGPPNSWKPSNSCRYYGLVSLA